MPSIPPAQLPSSETSESPSAPSKPGKYPPAKEPIIIPNIIILFRDIFVTRANAHYHVLLRNSKSSPIEFMQMDIREFRGVRKWVNKSGFKDSCLLTYGRTSPSVF